MFSTVYTSMPTSLRWHSECLTDTKKAVTRLDAYILKLRQKSRRHFWPQHNVSVIADEDLITITSLRLCIDVYVPKGLKNVVFVKIKPKGRPADSLMLTEQGGIEAIENALYEHTRAAPTRDCGFTDMYA